MKNIPINMKKKYKYGVLIIKELIISFIFIPNRIKINKSYNNNNKMVEQRQLELKKNTHN